MAESESQIERTIMDSNVSSIDLKPEIEEQGGIITVIDDSTVKEKQEIVMADSDFIYQRGISNQNCTDVKEIQESSEVVLESVMADDSSFVVQRQEAVEGISQFENGVKMNQDVSFEQGRRRISGQEKKEEIFHVQNVITDDEHLILVVESHEKVKSISQSQNLVEMGTNALRRSEDNWDRFLEIKEKQVSGEMNNGFGIWKVETKNGDGKSNSSEVKAMSVNYQGNVSKTGNGSRRKEIGSMGLGKKRPGSCSENIKQEVVRKNENGFKNFNQNQHTGYKKDNASILVPMPAVPQIASVRFDENNVFDSCLVTIGTIEETSECVILITKEDDGETLLEHYLHFTCNYTRPSGTEITIDRVLIEFDDRMSCDLIWDALYRFKRNASILDPMICLPQSARVYIDGNVVFHYCSITVGMVKETCEKVILLTDEDDHTLREHYMASTCQYLRISDTEICIINDERMLLEFDESITCSFIWDVIFRLKMDLGPTTKELYKKFYVDLVPSGSATPLKCTLILKVSEERCIFDVYDQAGTSVFTHIVSPDTLYLKKSDVDLTLIEEVDSTINFKEPINCSFVWSELVSNDSLNVIDISFLRGSMPIQDRSTAAYSLLQLAQRLEFFSGADDHIQLSKKKVLLLLMFDVVMDLLRFSDEDSSVELLNEANRVKSEILTALCFHEVANLSIITQLFGSICGGFASHLNH